MADPTPVAEKRCSGCREVRPAADFYKSSASKTGLQTYCKPCTRERQREWRAANPERVRANGRENMRRRRERDPEAMREYQRKWRTENPEKLRAHRAAWIQANYAKVRLQANAANRKWKAANPDKVRADNIAWAAKNPEKVAIKSRKWRQSHPFKVRANRSKRRALVRAATIGVIDLDLLWVRQCGICALCGLHINRSIAWPDPLSKSVDHIVPLSRGGTHEQANVSWTHLACNLKKGASAP